MTLPSARRRSSSACSFSAVGAGWSVMSGALDTVRLYLRAWMRRLARAYAVARDNSLRGFNLPVDGC